jgi:hypothetical protein
MFTRVTRDQFAVREGVFVHMPTQAEFTRTPIARIRFWCGRAISAFRLPGGQLFEYAEVFAMMRSAWRETFLTNSRLELTDA